MEEIEKEDALKSKLMSDNFKNEQFYEHGKESEIPASIGGRRGIGNGFNDNKWEPRNSWMRSDYTSSK